MAGRKAQPIELLMLKGRKNLTKAEIESRTAAGVKAPANKVRAPAYLSPTLKREFNSLAKQLKDINLISNFDVDTLASYVQTRAEYVRITTIVGTRLNAPDTEVDIDALNKAQGMQMRALNQLRALASELGLTVSSRAKLAIPRKQKEPENKFDRFGAVKEG